MRLSSIRQPLEGIKPESQSTNAGLWLDRLLAEQPKTKETITGKHPYTTHIEQVAQWGAPASYKRFFRRWEQGLQAFKAQLPAGYTLLAGKAKARGRIAVGLGAEGVLENAITLHRTYGVPYLPGSALKGLAAAYAHQYLADGTWRRPPTEIGADAPITAHEIVFGSTRSAGYVTFFDALYVPDNNDPPLASDVLTVHHPDYYQNDPPAAPPADWDSPTPISFVSATGTYLVALAGPEQWVTVAWNILARALDELGIGGKTSAGYGRMTLPPIASSTLPAEQPASPAAAAAPSQPALALPKQFEMALKKTNAGSLPNFMSEWRQLPPELRSLGAKAIIRHARDIKVKNLEEKPWFKELQQALAEGEQ
ncbi:type III-B CRISPR module RAMP protein Cmr6 [Chloroflexus sp.]|uniref:type III-B CRISPR module RAMP protein Cmr6 n=1 Tax=Chloroflexus sp. TaxID=1904827 RepID=UPI002ACE3C27|nr:type III-B CRISPR module RAMP protein Cmr6 [Chloroflexus sp.]